MLLPKIQGHMVGLLELRRQCGVSHEVQRGAQGARAGKRRVAEGHLLPSVMAGSLMPAELM